MASAWDMLPVNTKIHISEKIGFSLVLQFQKMDSSSVLDMLPVNTREGIL